MPFSFQTGFVFANQASGVKEEYLFFHNRSDLNKPDACGGDQQGCPKFELPKWLDCSEEANLKRDYYKALFEVRFLSRQMLHHMAQEGVNNTCNCNVTAYSGVYDNWNTEGKDRKSTPQTL